MGEPISMPAAYQISPLPARAPSDKRAFMSGTSSLELLLGARGRAASWLEASTRDLGPFSAPSFDDERFLSVYSSAGRFLGKASVELDAIEASQLEASGIDWPIEGWGLDELGRVVLLGRAFRDLAPDRAAALLEQCYFRGDNRERQAVLRALPFLPARARFVPMAIEACRTNVQPVFLAIACENPLPADEFPDSNFNQLVLKALFIGVALARIVGLKRRAGADLARMAADYAAERRAAGRSVPADIDLVLGRAFDPGATR